MRVVSIVVVCAKLTASKSKGRGEAVAFRVGYFISLASRSSGGVYGDL